MIGIDIHFINMDAAPERRFMVEQSFAASAFSSRWMLHRFAAVDAASSLVQQTPGKLSGPYKGNFLSHLNCVRQSLRSDKHLFMLEDDTQFCKHTGPLLERVIDSLPEDSWDVIHPEISLLSATDYPRFYKIRQALDHKDKVKLIDLEEFPHPYTGSGSYIVNRRSKIKLIQLIEYSVNQAQGRLDTPYDLYLRAFLKSKCLNGLLTVPFLTAPSIHADMTQAPWGSEDPSQEHAKQLHLQLSNGFRRLVWIGFDAAQVLPPILQTHGEQIFLLTDQDKLFQKIVSWMMFMQYQSPYKDYETLRFLPQEINLGSSNGPLP